MKIKKISALLAMGLCLTVGGVYAAWTYAQGSLEPQNVHIDPSIANKTTQTKKGSLTIAQGITITIDDVGTVDYVAEVVYGGTNLVVTFDPADGADQTVVDNGVTLMLKLSTTEEWTYNGVPIFAVDDGTYYSPALNVQADESKNEIGTFTKDTATGLFTWTVTPEDIQDKIALYKTSLSDTTTGDLILDTVEKYDAFHTELHKGDVIFTISEYVVTPPATQD